MLENKESAKDFVDMQNKVIDENINYRKTWEQNCKAVFQAYKGNYFPVIKYNKKDSTSSSIERSSRDDVYVNLIRRQYRVMANYLDNNEPMFVITENGGDISEGDLVAMREYLNNVFDGKYSAEYDSFYEDQMDDIIYYGLFRGVVWCMVIFNDNIWEFKVRDSMDTYIDLSARKLKDIKYLIRTYVISKNVLEKQYPNDGNGNPIKWDEVKTSNKQTESDTKETLLKDKPDSNDLIVREGWYLENEGFNPETGKPILQLYKVVTTQSEFLEKEKIEGMDFFPGTYFTAINDPENLYPESRYLSMVEITRRVNKIIKKLGTIVDTGGRYVYVRAGTVLTESTNKLMNSIGVEVIEVSEGGQELPQQATILTITQSDIQYLDLMMKQAEEEGGMRQEIMGGNTLGPDSSGIAIQSLQAGSKNNIGTVLNELNKFMNRLTRIVIRMTDIFGTDKIEVQTKQFGAMPMKKEILTRADVKVSITGKNAFDEITKRLESIQILDQIAKFNPNIAIPPSVITKIMGVTNDIADDIQSELDKQEDPDLQIAEGENKKLMQGEALNVNVTDNHEIHKALHTELLKNADPSNPAAKTIINHVRQHDAFLETGGVPTQPQ